jgi:hypothetical protein
MERKALRTCAGCGNVIKVLVKCCRVTTHLICSKGHKWSLAHANCSEYVPRFAKPVKKSTIEVELL